MLRSNSLQLGGRGGSKGGEGGDQLALAASCTSVKVALAATQHNLDTNTKICFRGRGHLDVESLLSSITHLRCVQASQNADNDHGAPGYAGAASSFVYRCQISEKYSSAGYRVSHSTLYYPRKHNFVHFLTTAH